MGSYLLPVPQVQVYSLFSPVISLAALSLSPFSRLHHESNPNPNPFPFPRFPLKSPASSSLRSPRRNLAPQVSSLLRLLHPVISPLPLASSLFPCPPPLPLQPPPFTPARISLPPFPQMPYSSAISSIRNPSQAPIPNPTDSNHFPSYLLWF